MNASNRSESLASLKTRFAKLPAPPTAALVGRYRGEIVGPAWLRRLGPAGLALSGLRGWWGKEFDGAGVAINLVERARTFHRLYPMSVDERPSKLDGGAVVALYYPPTAPPPWRWIVDELRLCDDGALLGMSVFLLPFGRTVSFPFMLRRD